MVASNKVNEAGYYELVEARLSRLGEKDKEKSINLIGMIHKWNIFESMDNAYLEGSCYLIDAVGLYYNFPVVEKTDGDYGNPNHGLKGEEEIKFVYRDYFNKELTHRFFVYAITDMEIVNPSNETALGYTLHFCSKEKFFTDRVDVRKSFKNGLISDYVKSIFEQYYINGEYGVDSTYDVPLTNESIVIEKTKGKQDIIIPNYKPDQALHMLTRRAISGVNSNKTQTYRFFQNRSKYYFASHDKLNVTLDQDFLDGNQKNKFIQVNAPDQSPLGQEFIMQNIVSIEFPISVNTIQDMNNGSYYKSTTEIDFMNRVILTTPYKYLDEYEDYVLPDTYQTSGGPGGGVDRHNNRSRHTKEFVDKHMTNYADTLVIKDYPYTDAGGKNDYIRQPAYYDQLFNPKEVNLYHHLNEMVDMEVYGRNTLTAGDSLEIEILMSIGNRDQEGGGLELDEERSGFYLIESIDNIFYEDTYTQKIKMSKSGIRGAPENVDNYNGKPQTVSVFLENTRGIK